MSSWWVIFGSWIWFQLFVGAVSIMECAMRGDYSKDRSDFQFDAIELLACAVMPITALICSFSCMAATVVYELKRRDR